MENILLKIDNLNIGYNGKSVCSNINLEVKNGDFVCIVGENGVGKTTFMKTILGLLKPINGEISILSNTKRFGYLPQINDTQRNFPSSVYEVVMSGCTTNDSKVFFAKEDKKKVDLILENLKIENLKDKRFKDLSGGQIQKVLLARALASCEELLLLDEPTNGLDPESRDNMYELLKNLNNNGITIIMISHDTQNIKKYVNSIIDFNKFKEEIV